MGNCLPARQILGSFSASLRSKRCHAEPQALLEVEVSLLVVVLVLLHVVLYKKGDIIQFAVKLYKTFYYYSVPGSCTDSSGRTPT